MNETGVQITAGLGGFLVLFGLCLALWFLGRDLTRRLRRMRRAEDVRLQQERQARPPAAQDGSAAERHDGGRPTEERADGDPIG
ncbi:hypothetical protein AVL62_05455 [Serinicoccus chungangensis]|uniref:Uncharacterized protein n=1 Tax=Serinicoccus chungangensis TaxID=767452 RepID=A0A0W8I8L5_9MICO|nr:hypothetical protein [Serinicoccus chungangensis]KUG55736.1 hypothetical protein AVL62_05455 [Serinicoccus chungangensis]